MLKLYNTLTRKIEEFKPIKKDQVGLYTCGPTVYNYAHIGNLRTYIFEDVLRRILMFNGYSVQHIMNITDVGHLSSDQDFNEDKMEQGAKTVEDIQAMAAKYTEAFLNDLLALNILPAHHLPKATDHIDDQIDIALKLIEKGFAYETPLAVYFDVNKFTNYDKLTRQKLEDRQTGARTEVVVDQAKKHPADFALWFKKAGKYKDHIQAWDSPWGVGFPGWHIECSAMSVKYLGQPFDIHTGGVDHIFPHHTNEIAQSEAAYGLPLANYWLHGEFLLIDSGRMGKSEGNFITLNAVIEKGFNPLAFRYLNLITHYRSKLNFTWDSLQAAENALSNLYEQVTTFELGNEGALSYEQQFLEVINNDMDMPAAMATVWNLVRSQEQPGAKLASLLKFDQILGLKIKEVWEAAKTIPKIVQDLVYEREKARQSKDFAKSDELRISIESNGYIVEDSPYGPRLRKKQR